MRHLMTFAAALAAFTLGGAAAAAAQSQNLTVGQQVSGRLTAQDRVLPDDNSYYDCFVLQTRSGQAYTIDYRSSDFDAWVSAGRGSDCNAESHLGDDDSGGGTNSRLTFTGDGRPWFIRANTLAAGETGAYTLVVNSASGPAPAPGKPPSGGGSSSGSGSGELLRPTDPQERFTWDAVCSAADTVALIFASEGMSDAQLEAWLRDSARLHEAVQSSGRAIGKSEDQISDEIANYGAAWLTDEELLEDVPPMDMRTQCLQQLR